MLGKLNRMLPLVSWGLMMVTLSGFPWAKASLAESQSQATEAPAPDPETWAKRLVAPGPAYLHRLVVLAQAPEASGALQLPRADLDALARLSFVEFIPPDDALWNDQINRRTGWAGRGVGGRLSALLTANAADAALILPPTSAEPSDLVLLKPEGDEALTHPAKTAQLKGGIKALAMSLRKLLGYDGVVLAQEGPYVLTRTPELGRAAKLFHAVALADSADKDVVATEATVASAFLRLETSNGHLAVWRLVSASAPGPLPLGTKLWLEVGRR